MYMLQLLISLLVFSNVFHQTYAVVGMDNWAQENQTTPSEGDSSDIDRILIENATIYNSTPSIDEKPREAGGPSSLPLYQPANIFSSGGQSLGASPLVAGSMMGQGQQGWAGGQGQQGQQGWAGVQGQQGQQGWAGGQGLQGYGNQGLQGYGNFGAGKGSLGAMVGAKGKNVGADFIPPPIGPPYPVFNGIGNIYTGFGGGFWCEGCGGRLVIPPLPPIPPQIFPPTYTWFPFPPLPPFPNVIGPAIVPPVAPVAPMMPPPMQQDSSMGQQLLQNPGFGGGFGMGKGGFGQQLKGQQNFPLPMQQQQQQGQAMQPILGQEQNQQMQAQNFPILSQQGQNQQMQGQNFPILSQQGQNQQMQGPAMQGF